MVAHPTPEEPPLLPPWGMLFVGPTPARNRVLPVAKVSAVSPGLYRRKKNQPGINAWKSAQPAPPVREAPSPGVGLGAVSGAAGKEQLCTGTASISSLISHRFQVPQQSVGIPYSVLPAPKQPSVAL